MEVLWSARDLPNFEQIRRTLGALDNYPIEPRHWMAAEVAMGRLIEISCRRAVQFPDLLLAAVAESNGVGVLHYDSDFDLLRENEVFNIETQWAVDRGTADVPNGPSAPELPS
jgi:predicted nucleic acid-binding protein